MITKEWILNSRSVENTVISLCLIPFLFIFVIGASVTKIVNIGLVKCYFCFGAHKGHFICVSHTHTPMTTTYATHIASHIFEDCCNDPLGMIYCIPLGIPIRTALKALGCRIDDICLNYCVVHVDDDAMRISEQLKVSTKVCIDSGFMTVRLLDELNSVYNYNVSEEHGPTPETPFEHYVVCI